ncbi:type 2 DNA topoisomerase 6 subunit B-like isoform X3 [Brachyhypopomus gauderio]|uniref:type 2 DNA topoisomerase 6 subunit B-like isoform X3 n=1 Tax=Brachyhypopomus gauderio TaxID=698409 RepID=UPI0040435C41
MTSKLQQVIRLLMVLTRNDYTESKRSSARPDGRGGLLVLRVHSMQAVRRPTYTVAAAGPWCFRMSEEHVQNEATARLSSSIYFCDCPCEEDLQMFSNIFGPLHFVCSFQDDQDKQETEAATATFLQRLSLVNAKVTIVFKVRDKEHSHSQVFRAKNRLSLMDHAISMDSTIFSQTPFTMACLPTCTRMHPVLGERVALLLPSEVMEAGLCGELSMATLATLRPCMDQYPNWPTRLSHIHVLVYSPSGVPLKRGEGATQLSFLHSLADSPAWAELGQARVRHAESQSGQGSVSCEVEFSVDDEDDTQPQGRRVEPEHTVQQTVMLFLLFEYRDPFHSQLSDVIGSEETLERCLDKVLWYNDDKVRSALQSLLKSALRGFLKRNKSQERLQSAMSVILSSVKSIVSSSSSVDFRTACLTTMKVQSSYDLSFPLHQKLQRVINGRFVSRSRCTSEKASETIMSEWNSHEEPENGLPSKRTHEEEEEEEETPSCSKRQCSEFTAGDSYAFESNIWETLDNQMQWSQGSQRELVDMGLAESSTPSLSNTELKKQQVDREWLQEIENLSEWD